MIETKKLHDILVINNDLKHIETISRTARKIFYGDIKDETYQYRITYKGHSYPIYYSKELKRAYIKVVK